MKAEGLRAQAHRLYLEQREYRGWFRAKDLEGKPCRLLLPYLPTSESEARARRILSLRKQAARMDAYAR